MRNARMDEAQSGIKIARRNISNLRYADDTTLMEESEEELKSLLMKVKNENEKAGLKQQETLLISLSAYGSEFGSSLAGGLGSCRQDVSQGRFKR